MTGKTKRSMRILIVAEKPRAAEQITFALCEHDKKPKLARKSPIKVWEIKRDGKVYRITSALGHLYTTEFAKSVHQKPWREVDPKYLLTKAPLVKVTRPESRKAIDVIREEARKAHLLIIATDYDREGENIGMQVAELIAKKVNPRIVVKRARFSSLTRKELLNAFKEENLVELDRRKIDASEVRQELDLRYGVAFTRLATIKFHERMGESGLPLLSIGPCQTPTLGLIVDRYLKHIESKERAEREKKYVIELTCMINGTGIKFKSIQEFQNPDGAKSYISSIGDSLEIENVSRKEVTIARPLPLNTTRLATIAASYLKLQPHETLSLSEKLYLEGLISYPRTETNKYPEGFDFKTPLNAVLKSAIANEIISYISSTPNPLNGRHDDKAHPPIYPIKPHPRDGSKRWIIWEYIARRFIANVYSKDARIARQKVRVFIGGIELTASGSLIDDEGFYKIFPYFKPSINPLPRVRRGAIVYVKNVVVREGKTQPPKRLSEADLLSLMIKHNIGTDATRARYPKLIIDRNYAVKRRGRFRPTGLGMKLIEALESVDKRLVTPDTRRYVEELMERIGKGEIEMDEALEKAIEEYKKLYLECEKNADIIEEILSESLRELNEKH